jgi:hypothetical protein
VSEAAIGAFGAGLEEARFGAGLETALFGPGDPPTTEPPVPTVPTGGIASAVAQIIAASSAVVAQGLLAGNVWVNRGAQSGDTPYLVVQQVTGDRMGQTAMQGRAGLVDGRVQLDLYGYDDQALSLISWAVLSSVERYAGTSGGLVIQDIYVDSEQSAYLAPDRLWRRIIDLRVIWQED